MAFQLFGKGKGSLPPLEESPQEFQLFGGTSKPEGKGAGYVAKQLGKGVVRGLETAAGTMWGWRRCRSGNVESFGSRRWPGARSVIETW